MKKTYDPKPLFIERMKELLDNNFDDYWKKIHEPELKSIRVNTLKITIIELKKRLENKGWKINQPFKEHPEILVIESTLEPGELGRSLEHLLGYYYVQEIASMLPSIILNPKENELVLDLCAAPGSKTSQMAAMMGNKGSIIANEVNMGRMKILASNLERCGATNVIITKQDGIEFCRRLKRDGFEFDKILVDAPCSGEGTIRSTPKTLLMWNIKKIESLSRLQKFMLSSAVEILKVGGELVYSTCTHAPEENEEVLDFVLKKFNNIKIEKIHLPVKTSQGLNKWKDKEYVKDVKNSCRIYPHESNTEGFFISKIKKVR